MRAMARGSARTQDGEERTSSLMPAAWARASFSAAIVSASSARATRPARGGAPPAAPPHPGARAPQREERGGEAPRPLALARGGRGPRARGGEVGPFVCELLAQQLDR